MTQASERKRPRAMPWPWIAAAAAWLLCVSAGTGALWDYSLAPGMQAQPAERWPTASRIERNRDGATLVMFAHPHCPCTRASLNELALILARTQGRLDAHVLLFEPPQKNLGWPEDGSFARAAAEIPGVHVLLDEDGAEAKRFGALTSGQTLLYDAAGRLAFSGGITAARGHQGDNAGRSAVVSLVNDGTGALRTPVFGCAIFGAPASGL